MTSDSPSDASAPAASEANSIGGYPAFAEGLLLATCAALLLTLPAALRVSAAGHSFATSWLALAGVTAVPLGLCVGSLRSVRPLSSMLAAVPLGALLALPLLAAFGAVLKQTTHHRPLGAVTFTILAAIVLLGAIAISARLLQLATGAGRSRGLARAALLLLALAAVGVLVRLLVGAGLSSSVLDGCLVVLTGAVGVWWQPPSPLRRVARLAGPLACAGLGLAGVYLMRSAGLNDALQLHAPVFSTLCVWLS